MVDRVGHEARPLEPAGSALVERAPLVLLDLRAEVVREQAVVAIPAPLGIERDDEEVRPFGSLEEGVGIGATRELAAQVAREALRDRGPDQERPEVVFDPAQGLVGEVVEDEPLAAPERLDHRRRVRPVAQRDRGELDAGDPALGLLDEALDERVRERDAQAAEVRRGFVRPPTQVVHAQLDEPSVGPQPRQRHGRILAGQQYEVNEGRAPLDEEADETMDRLGSDELVVVDHEDERVVGLGQRLDERGTDELRARGRPGTEETPGRIGGRRPDRAQGRGEVPGETGEVVVGRVQREPGERRTARREPAGHGDRLSVARRGRQQGQPGAVLESTIEHGAEAWTLSVGPHRGRSPELGRDERVPKRTLARRGSGVRSGGILGRGHRHPRVPISSRWFTIGVSDADRGSVSRRRPAPSGARSSPARSPALRPRSGR